jgi:hypothetical protein
MALLDRIRGGGQPQQQQAAQQPAQQRPRLTPEQAREKLRETVMAEIKEQFRTPKIDPETGYAVTDPETGQIQYEEPDFNGDPVIRMAIDSRMQMKMMEYQLRAQREQIEKLSQSTSQQSQEQIINEILTEGIVERFPDLVQKSPSGRVQVDQKTLAEFRRGVMRAREDYMTEHNGAVPEDKELLDMAVDYTPTLVQKKLASLQQAGPNTAQQQASRPAASQQQGQRQSAPASPQGSGFPEVAPVPRGGYTPPPARDAGQSLGAMNLREVSSLSLAELERRAGIE